MPEQNHKDNDFGPVGADERQSGRNYHKWAGYLFILIVTAILVAGIYLGKGGNNTDQYTPPTTIVSNQSTILLISLEVGLCEEGLCISTITVNSDGTYVEQIAHSKEVDRLDSKDLSELRALINSTDLEKVKNTKFVGVCPMSYDGQRHVFTFYLPNGELVIDDCESKIDYTFGLFAKIKDLFGVFQLTN